MKTCRCIKEFYAPSDNNESEYLVEKLSIWEFYYLGWTEDQLWGVKKDDKKIIQIRDVYFKEYFEEIKK